MNDTTTATTPRTAPRLGAAFFAAAAMVAAGLVDAFLRLLGHSDVERLARASPVAFIALASGLVYLACIVIWAYRVGQRLRRVGPLARWETTLAALAHLLVLGVAGWIIVRGYESPTLFVGLDRLVAALAVAATLSLALTLTAMVSIRAGGEGRGSRMPYVLLALAFATAAAFYWLESVNVWTLE